jgi:eukaryotic-like serine/threonine-protein kinase
MSRPEAAALLSLAESIADGAPIDWQAAEAGASERDRVLIGQLRVLSDLAGLHRSLPAVAGEPRRAAAERQTLAAPAIGSWAHLALIERLGGGTSGDVYRAWDRHLERDVALKLLRADESTDDLHASRIAREGRLLARVRHANVITVHGVDAHDGRVGLWMELVRGVTLEQQIAAHGPLSAREAAAVGIDLCRALAAVHAAGLIHRDVKAQNVMREDGGRIVLMDLGTGREIAAAGDARSSDLAGTPLYLAPEIFAGAAASERTDLYSLGVLLYRLVTGSFPVRATTIEELHAGHTHGRRVRVRDARADLPTAFVRVIDRAIAADPEQRYATAGAFEADLVEALGNTATTIVVRKSRKARGATRRTTLSRAGITIAVLAATIAIALVGWPKWWFLPAPIPLSARDALLVTDFVNLTGESVFDGTLKEAVTVQLQQSPYLNAFGARGVEIATPAGGGIRTPEQRAAAARALCNRRHMKAMVSGSIATAGDGYAVSVAAQNCQTGEVIGQGEGTASSRPAVLRALGVATARLREQLGDRSATNQQFNVPIEDATTSSLDALRAYTAGMDSRARGGEADAIPYFNHALELDPKFALAEGRLAAIYANLHEFEQSKTHIRKAYELSAHVTERERLYIRGSYYLNAVGQLDEAVGAYRLWAALYPLDWLPHNNLAAVFYQIGQFDRSLKEAEAARSLSPEQVIPYQQIALTQLALGRFDACRETLHLAETRGLDAVANRAMLVQLALIEGGVDAARAALAAPPNRAEDVAVVAAAARAEAFAGDFDAARRLIAQAAAAAESRRMNDVAASLIAEDALNAALVGDADYARRTLDRALAISRGSETLWFSSLAAAFAGRPTIAAQLAAEYAQRTPPTTDVIAVSAPVLTAAMDVMAGRNKEGIEALHAAIPYERIGRFWPAYLRGLSYARLNQPAESAAQFEDILRHREDNPASLLFSLARLQLARARAAAGDSNGARAAYDEFITAWGGDGRPNALVATARRERSRLRPWR